MLLLVVLTLLAWRPATALAHALLERSDPPALSVLPSSPTEIHLWFTEDLNGSASNIVVWDRFRHVENIGHASIVPGQPRQMTVGVKPLAAGTYLVLWTSVSADDGHILNGYYLFSVQHPGPAPSLSGLPSSSATQTWPDGTTLGGIISHWLELLAAVVWLGAVAFSALIFTRFTGRLETPVLAAEARRVRLLVRASLVVLTLASTALVALQAHALAGDWSGVLSGNILAELFSSAYGKLWIWRQTFALLALVTTFEAAGRWVGRRVSPPRPPWYLLAGVYSLIYLYLFAASGHAASARVWTVLGHTDVSGSVIADWLHFVGVALWFGGQVYIVAVLAPALRVRRELGPHAGVFLQALNRFSPIAYLSVAFFSLSGLFNAKIHLFSWYAFFHSVYGWALIVKLALVGIMMLISALTVFGIRPRIRHVLGVAEGKLRTGLRPGPDMVERGAMMMGGLLSLLRGMPVLGCAVLAATSMMFYYPVPVGLSPPGPSTFTARAGGVTATVSLKPNRAGPNTITVMLADAHGKPIRQATVVVLETMTDMVMGQGKAVLKEKAPGTFSGIGDLGMGGHWRLDLLVFTPAGLTKMSVAIQVGS